MNDKDINQDALALCLEIQESIGSWKAYGTNRPIASDDPHAYTLPFLRYFHPLTPYYLQDLQILIMTNLAWSDSYEKKPNGYRYVDINFEKLNAWVIAHTTRKFGFNSEPPKNHYVISHKWQYDSNKRRGILKINNEYIKFQGGNATGVNLLIENLGKNVTSKSLKDTIISNSNNKCENFRLSQWKYDLITDRKDFFKYFKLEYIKPSSYILNPLNFPI